MNKFSTLCPCCSNKNSPSLNTLKKVGKFFKENGISFFLVKDKLINWRIRAKLAVRSCNKKLTLGLFKEKTHEVISVENCRAHYKLITKVILLIEKKAKLFNIPPYDDISLKGDLRYVQISISNKAQVVLVVNQEKLSPKMKKFIRSLTLNRLIDSIWINYNTKDNNVIFSNNWGHFLGNNYLMLSILNKKFVFHPAAFLQAHLQIFEKMIKYIKNHIRNNTNILELYAGVGVIGLSLISKCKNLKLVEINPFSKLSFDESLNLSFFKYRHKISYECKDASDFDDFNDYNTIILDPPRKGLSKKVLQNLIPLTNKTIIYVSCNFISFEKDVFQLQTNGWKLTDAKCFLMFPNSDHLEIIGVLKKSSK